MIHSNYSLLNHNSFGFDIHTKYFFSYSSEKELIEFLNNDLNGDKLPAYHIGNGCNLLFTKDFEGTILFSEIKFIETEKEFENRVWIRVGAGVVFDDLCEEMSKRNLAGIENLSYIPSQVGAAAIQNIGAYGVEIKDVILEVEAIDITTGSKKIFKNEECQYEYRSSIFKTSLKDKYIVTSVLLELQKEFSPNIQYKALYERIKDKPKPTIKDIRKEIIHIRKEKLPDHKILGNAGSFFKNPYCSINKLKKIQQKYPDMPFYPIDNEKVKLSSAYLIDQCGFKGKRFGNVGAYERQPLVLVNYGGGCPEDIINLAMTIQKEVKGKFDIMLEREVIYI